MMGAALGERVRIMMGLNLSGGVVAGAFLACLLLPAAAFAEPPSDAGTSEEEVETATDPGSTPEPAPAPSGPYPYVLAIINDGVVTNVAALSYDNDYSAFWSSMQAQNDEVRRVPVGSAGVGWVVLPDGSLGPEPPPTPPEELPRPEEDAGEWQRTGPTDPSPAQPRTYPYVLAIVNDGVVTNVAALSYDNDYSEFWSSMQAQNDHVLRVRRAGIGWTLMSDGSLAPPAPRPGMVWNGSEWRAPGTEDVDRGTDVRGWALDRDEPVRPAAPDDADDVDDTRRAYEDGWLRGRIIVPDEALTDGVTPSELAERSIVILESHGDDVTPLLARFDGLQALLSGADEAVDRAVEVHAATTGEPVEEESVGRLQDARRRLVVWAQSVFGLVSIP